MFNFRGDTRLVWSDRKIRLEKPALNNFKAYGLQKLKTKTEVFEVKNYVDEWFSNPNFIT